MTGFGFNQIIPQATEVIKTENGVVKIDRKIFGIHYSVQVTIEGSDDSFTTVLLEQNSAKFHKLLGFLTSNFEPVGAVGAVNYPTVTVGNLLANQKTVGLPVILSSATWTKPYYFHTDDTDNAYQYRSDQELCDLTQAPAVFNYTKPSVSNGNARIFYTFWGILIFD